MSITPEEWRAGVDRLAQFGAGLAAWRGRAKHPPGG
jgi:hypothetical protein